MEDNVRNGLIIVSAIVIVAILVHGIWTIRKNKNPYKLKAKDGLAEPSERGFDSSGFDQDGVSKPRVVEENLLTDEEIPEAPAPAPQDYEDPLPIDVEEPTQDDVRLEPEIGDLSDIAEQPPEDDVPPLAQSLEEAPEFEEQVELEAPVYAEPVTQAKPTVPARKKASRKKKSRDQMEMNFGDDFDTSEQQVKAKKAQVEEPEPEVIVVSVVMPDGQMMSGAALLPTLLTLGLRFGDMDIFHRHEDAAGNGKVTFSVANMMNPGTFDLDNMENFDTPGISLFMTLPNAGDPFEVFESMMTAAKHLAVEFKAQLLDDKRSVMTKQTEQHYTSRIREFERKSRIAAY